MHKCHSLLFLVLLSPVLNAGDWPSFDLLQLNSLKNGQTINISIKNDPVYKIKKHYKVFSLKTVIEKLRKTYTESINHSLIVFTAEDGYKVTMSYIDAIKEEGYIAFKDIDAENESWVKFKFGNQYITPAPYYLVWPDSTLDKWRYPSPFQLSHISLQSMESYYSGAVPESKNQQAKTGFSLFSRYCIKCHAVNTVGGTLGPELNASKNITDRLSEDQFSRFVFDATEFNAMTKMPVFKKMLNKKEVDQVYFYLKSMKSSFAAEQK